MQSAQSIIHHPLHCTYCTATIHYFFCPTHSCKKLAAWHQSPGQFCAALYTKHSMSSSAPTALTVIVSDEP